MKISIQYHQVGDRHDTHAAARDPRTPVAWQVVDLPMPPRVGDTVLVDDELSAGELAVTTVLWDFSTANSDRDVLVITKPQ
ncbi:Uncharacterised protein [Mycobacteroides abscessus subsp. abscessus]|uniref:hypothetical protein n=1 Tax=Mycobacteroides abscessus TaxID=36809 RepID=UPI0009286DDB|nr:hypothetical protein [Mycobacteroides abscessus]SHX98413.1 Uncharacterised protein [Mycobacteroides abscessus subsp. abscessus]SIC79929.1 Uncharacterised protein [Mycobacteroides abscessus subsp. abscessus]SKK32704.1 Uncharacterised protein [Mycobacteroides abscessus subsp. abscessus]SKP26368.1 Uncharacterised protein [Mycobacteroides abscessus subsp. abscessus]